MRPRAIGPRARGTARARAVALSALAALAVLLLFAVGPAVGSPAGRDAAASSSEQDAEARAARSLATGIQALQAGDKQAAYDALAESYRLARNPEVLFHLGMLALAENRALPARDLLLRFQADPGPELSADSPLLKEAQRVLQQPAPPAAELNILGERSTLVYLDGRLIGALPLPCPVTLSPEEHAVALLHDGRRLQGQVRIPEGRIGELRFDYATGALLSAVLPGIVLLQRYQDAPPEAVRELTASLGRAVQTERLSARPLSRQPESVAPADACQEDPACQIELGSKAGAEYVLGLRARHDDSGWQIRMSLLSVEIGAAAAERDSPCPGCSVTQAAQLIGDGFAALWGEAQSRSRGSLEVRSVPTAASVWLDGVKVGQTPYTHAVWTGKHRLDIRAEGLQDDSRDIDVGDGKTEVVQVQLDPPEPAPSIPPPAEQKPRPRWRLVSGSLALGGAALLVGFGAAALSVNGSCADTPSVPGAECVYLYRSLPIGASLVGVGGALALGGIVLLATPGKRNR